MVEQLGQLEVCLPYSRLLAGIPILSVFQNLRWNSNKTTLMKIVNGNIQCLRLKIMGGIFVEYNLKGPDDPNVPVFSLLTVWNENQINFLRK